MDYGFHDLAGLFPMMDGEAFSELVQDVRDHGIREPIVLLDGLILDGRNRYRAARECGAEIPTVDFEGDDPLAFVLSLNLRRRHLSESQRATVAAKVENTKQGRPENNANLQVSRSTAAKMLNVSERSVASAAVVLERGSPELIAAVEIGQASVSAAAEVARLPEPEQKQIVAKGEKEILEAAKRIRSDRAESKRVERVTKISEIAKGNAPLGTAERYPVIYADPPWRYENAPMGGDNRAIENHYPTMTLEEICALPVGALAADDAVLFLWATAPKLSECMTVIEAWGFTYRTCMVWVKEQIGMGYWARSQHELLLIAKKGEIPPPPPSARPSSVLMAPRDKHSAKPHEYYELIEAMCPGLPKIELFCRSPQPGWAVWGNQSQ